MKFFLYARKSTDTEDKQVLLYSVATYRSSRMRKERKSRNSAGIPGSADSEITRTPGIQRYDKENRTMEFLRSLEMRMDSEITQEEYQVKKDDLLKDKHKYEELLKDAIQRVETWLDRAETMFNFAETLKGKINSIVKARDYSIVAVVVFFLFGSFSFFVNYVETVEK